MSIENSEECVLRSENKKSVLAVVITVSDRSARGIRKDESGPIIKEILSKFNITCAEPVIISDGIESVRQAVQNAIDNGTRLVFTTGGTGVGPRDLTPEACAPLISCRLEGLEIAAIMEGVKHTPMAGISRCQIGLTSREKNAAMIVNAPGSTGGARDMAKVIGPLVLHILDQVSGGDH